MENAKKVCIVKKFQHFLIEKHKARWYHELDQNIAFLY